MTQRSGIGSYLEQDRANGEGPKAAYLMTSGGVYRFGSGKKAAEATAFLRDASGVLVLDSDSTTETRALYLIGTSTINV